MAEVVFEGIDFKAWLAQHPPVEVTPPSLAAPSGDRLTLEVREILEQLGARPDIRDLVALVREKVEDLTPAGIASSGRLAAAVGLLGVVVHF